LVFSLELFTFPCSFLSKTILFLVTKNTINSDADMTIKIRAILCAELTISCCLSGGKDMARKASTNVNTKETKYIIILPVVGGGVVIISLVICISLHLLFPYCFDFYCVFWRWNSEFSTVDADDLIKIWICNVCP